MGNRCRACSCDRVDEYGRDSLLMRLRSGIVGVSRIMSERQAAGFAYLGLLIMLAVIGIVGATALQIGKAIHRRAAEEALLDIGLEFGQALESYRRATPVGQPDAPFDLKDLLKDPRHPGAVRHLRKIFDDPMTGNSEWGISRSEDTKRIEGVYSLSDDRPIKVANFDFRYQGFEGKSSYRQWVFTRLQTNTAGMVGVDGGSSGGRALIDPRESMGEREATSPAQPATSGAPSAYISPHDL